MLKRKGGIRMMKNILEVKNVSYAYHTLQGETPVLNHVSFSIQPGEFVAIVGPSGCGKSTLLSLIAGLLSPDEGNICLECGKKTGYMLQKDHLLEWRSTSGNVVLGPEISRQKNKQTRKRMEHLLESYGLAEFAEERPSRLSGGMRQRAALIRTLMTNPDLLLLDEPFSALDYQTRLSVSDDVWHILKTEQKTALLITHDISEAISMADRIIVLSPRPSTVRCQFPVNLTCPKERTPFFSRSAPEFKDYFNLVWKELNH
jgi:NitT/TauT family transport system ATP-binding protein